MRNKKGWFIGATIDFILTFGGWILAFNQYYRWFELKF